MGILCITGFIILAGLLLPIKFSLRANNDNQLCVDIKVAYGWGFVSYNYYTHGCDNNAVIRVMGLVLRRIPLSTGDGRSKEKKKDKEGKDFKHRMRFKKLRPYGLNIIKDIFGLVIGKHAAARLKLGFDDPAYTGMVSGFMACAMGRFCERVQYVPDFSGENFEVDLHISGTIIPITLFFIGLKYCKLYLGGQLPA